MELAMPGRPSLLSYWESCRYRRLATNPFSFMPSEVAMSKDFTVTLPNLETQCAELPSSTAPSLEMPRG